MKKRDKKSERIDNYIASKNPGVQALLMKMRSAIRKAAPDAEETISYGIPTLRINGKNLVHFAAFTKHIGFYPTSSGIAAFKEDLSKYKSSKGSVQFPFDKPLPLALVARITKFRVKEVITNASKTKRKAS